MQTAAPVIRMVTTIGTVVDVATTVGMMSIQG
jgi:hypothetical protein